MKFDSTAYLVFYLKEKLNYTNEIINCCIGILDGFSIQPGSIKYDENSNLITLSLFLPNSELNISKVAIAGTRINMLLSVRDTTINLNCESYGRQVQASALINSFENNCAGIYYYDSRVMNIDHPNYAYQGLISYYDIETLNTIKNEYLHNMGINLNGLVGYKQDRIKTLGFVPDVTEWKESAFNKKDFSYSDFAMKINNQLKDFNYDSFMDSLVKFAKKPETVINPVTRR